MIITTPTRRSDLCRAASVLHLYGTCALLLKREPAVHEVRYHIPGFLSHCYRCVCVYQLRSTSSVSWAEPYLLALTWCDPAGLLPGSVESVWHCYDKLRQGCDIAVTSCDVAVTLQAFFQAVEEAISTLPPNSPLWHSGSEYASLNRCTDVATRIHYMWIDQVGYLYVHMCTFVY